MPRKRVDEVVIGKNDDDGGNDSGNENNPILPWPANGWLAVSYVSYAIQPSMHNGSSSEDQSLVSSPYIAILAKGYYIVGTYPMRA